MSHWNPDRAPISEDRLRQLRWVMGPEVWDAIYPYLPETFIQAYDTVVEALYGGDVTGVEEADVTDGGKKVTSKWPLRDSRLLPVKAGMDYLATQIARQLLKAQAPKAAAGPHRPPTDSRVGVASSGSAGSGPSGPQRTT